MYRYISILIVLFSASVSAQNMESRSSITAEFSAPAIAAYQENSHNKIVEFYSYLELLTNASISVELKNQLKENIYSLYSGPDLQVIDIFSGQANMITLKDLLQKAEEFGELGNLTFEVTEIESSATTFSNHWLNNYVLQINSEDETFVKNLSQRIYFAPKQKNFGSNQKEVWVIQLGEILD